MEKLRGMVPSVNFFVLSEANRDEIVETIYTALLSKINSIHS